MRFQAYLLTVLVLLAGCATPSQRISSKLIDYGVPEPQAICVGDKLQERLTLSQLHRIGEITKASRNEEGRMNLTQLAASLNKPGDEAIVAEVFRAGVGCVL